ncbi:MAG: bifunctional tRNA (5-methylaminomethyl-2-thiouridine)(34)-methyltransferase MnmD/FAD-dependent 5-carboxymethylaminomethyl-2-thiouridine(34) oxidoreductase MnmC [Pseudomonadota bacterium]
MLRSEGRLQALERAQLKWRDGAPYSRTFDDCYYSEHGGLEEARYVFLRGNDLEERFLRASQRPFSIGELGFGTGLNFIATWEAFARRAGQNARLHYWSVERYPLTTHELTNALQPFAQLGRYAAELIHAYPARIEGVHRLLFEEGRITLDLVFADALDALEDTVSFGGARFDAWFLDGFAPARNEDLWTGKVLENVARLGRRDSTVASYTAAGHVRRTLSGYGYRVEKRSGFASKRECITGRLLEPRKATAVIADWDLPTQAPATTERVLVIGAGLAGAHVAAALARRDVPTTVRDTGPVAGRASGNAQGVLYTRLSHQRSVLGDFSLAAFQFASRLYRSLLEGGALESGIEGELCGCLFTGFSPSALDKLAESLSELPDLGVVLTQQAASAKFGTELLWPALFLPDSGWLRPSSVCRALLESPSIDVQTERPSMALKHEGGRWLASCDGESTSEYSSVVIAAGVSTTELDPEVNLPTGVVRGQTTQLPASLLPPLQTALCHRGYLAPASEGEHCIGASFHPGDASRDLRPADNEHNIRKLADALPLARGALEALDPAALAGRAEVRCVSPDYLPMVGQIHDESSTEAAYAPLRRKAKAVIEASGAHQHPGLFVSTGFGSRGLSYAALAAEVLASQICGEAPAVSRNLNRALAPCRFQIRAMIRGHANL